jgi:S1/P1 Nuclease
MIALALLITLQSATPVWAWGRLGHRVISRLAERHLTPQAKAAILELVEPGESLADASLWADEQEVTRLRELAALYHRGVVESPAELTAPKKRR